MRVVFWDGESKMVRNRAEAITTIKEGLAGWMQEGDRLIWYADREGELPNQAYVANEVGEVTDAGAIIKWS